MNRVVDVTALPGFRVKLRFADGVEGEADLSRLAGKGVFKKWDTPGVFESASIGEAGQLAWGDDLDLCPDALYMQVTGKTPQEVFPALARESANA